MNILFTKPVQNEIKRRKDGQQIPIRQILAELEKINTREILKSSNIRRMSYDGSSDIYVLRVKDLRVFFTQKGEDLVIVSILNHDQLKLVG